MEDHLKKIAYLEKIIALSPGNVYWKDIHGKYLGCNENCAKILKLPNREAIIGKTDYDLMSQELADAVRKADCDIMAKNEKTILEEVGFDIHGKPAIYLTEKVPLHDEQDRVCGILGISINITERKLSEKKLQEANLSLEMNNQIKSKFILQMSYIDNLIAMLPGNIYWKNREGVYLGCNDNAAKIVGFKSRDEVIGKRLSDFVDKKYAETIEQNDEKIMLANQAETLEEKAFDQEGNPAIYLTRKAPLHDEKGNVIGLLGISLDISDRIKQEKILQEAKQKAEAANQAKSDFLSLISHELRIPLASVLGLAQLMNTEDLSTTHREQLTDLMKSANHLLSLVNDLLDIAKLEAGKMELHYMPINLQKILDDVAAMTQPQAHAKGIKFIVSYSEKIPPEIISDPKILRQIILNLVNNAVKFTEKGHVNIKIDYIENDQLPALLLLVEDTGIGIPTEKQSSIFDRFAQVDALRTRRYGGTGLGLALVKEYIQTLGGTINLKSELGKGTLFICQIPIKLIPVENPQTIKIEAIDKNINTGTTPIKRVLVSTPQILIVEDEPIIQRIHKAMLEQFLFTVDIAATGKQALSLYDKKDYDLIFMDIGLPDMDGFDITRQIRLKQAHRSHSSIVAITAYDNNQDREKCFLAGMDDVIIKPVNLQQLKQIVDKFLKYS